MMRNKAEVEESGSPNDIRCTYDYTNNLHIREMCVSVSGYVVWYVKYLYVVSGLGVTKATVRFVRLATHRTAITEFAVHARTHDFIPMST